MPRFYISDGARPGRRTPATEYATKAAGVGSDVLNEAQAIARGRKLAPTMGLGFNRFRFTFSGSPKAQFGWVTGAQGGIAACASQDGVGTNMFDGPFVEATAGDNWSNLPATLPNLFRNAHYAIGPYSYSPTWVAVRLSTIVNPKSFQMIEYTGEGGAWRYTTGTVTIDGSTDGVAWSTIKVATGADFVVMDTYAGGGWYCTRYYINV